jgi:hypothetical protein
MKRLANMLGFALVIAALFAACGAAATLALGSKTLSAGNASVTSCGVSSLSSIRSVDNGGNITAVVVSGVPAACAGETLSLTLADSSGTSLGSASAAIPAGGGSMTFSSFSTVSAANVKSYQYAVAGA